MMKKKNGIEKMGECLENENMSETYSLNCKNIVDGFFNTPNFIGVGLTLLYGALFQGIYRFFSYMYHVDFRTNFPNGIQEGDLGWDTFLMDHNVYGENIEYLCLMGIGLLIFNFIISQILCIREKKFHWLSFSFCLLFYLFVGYHYIFKVGFSIF